MHGVTGPPQSAGVNVGGKQQHAPCHPQSVSSVSWCHCWWQVAACPMSSTVSLHRAPLTWHLFCTHSVWGQQSRAWSSSATINVPHQLSPQTTWGFSHSHLRNSLRKGCDWILTSGWNILCVYQPQDSGWPIFSAFGQKRKQFLYTLMFFCNFSK